MRKVDFNKKNLIRENSFILVLQGNGKQFIHPNLVAGDKAFEKLNELSQTKIPELSRAKLYFTDFPHVAKIHAECLAEANGVYSRFLERFSQRCPHLYMSVLTQADLESLS